MFKTTLQDLVTFFRGVVKVHGGQKTWKESVSRSQTDPKYETELGEGWKKHWLRRVARSNHLGGVAKGLATVRRQRVVWRIRIT